VAELQESLVESAREAGGAIDSMNQAVEASRQQWHQRKDALAAALEALQAAVSKAAEVYGQEIEDHLEHERTEVLVGELANAAAIPAYNATVELLRQRFDEEPSARAAQDLSAPAEALAALEQTCADEAEGLAAWSEALRAELSGAAARAGDQRKVAAAAAALA
jgi:hypothetical protein